MVFIRLDGSQYAVPPLPPKTGRYIDLDSLSILAPDIATGVKVAIPLLILGTTFADPLLAMRLPWLAWVLSRGVFTETYALPDAPQPQANQVKMQPVSSLTSQQVGWVDDSQPFPISGQLSLKWSRYIEPS